MFFVITIIITGFFVTMIPNNLLLQSAQLHTEHSVCILQIHKIRRTKCILNWQNQNTTDICLLYMHTQS